MNTLSHILMGSYLQDYVREEYGIFLDRETFIYGNVLPDYRLSFLTRPHFLDNNIRYVKKEIRDLLNKKQTSACIGKQDSKRLGIICHYYADFFCHAHSINFSGGLVSHAKYEEDLYQYLLKNLAGADTPFYSQAAGSGADAETVYRNFSRLHMEYLTQTPSFHSDLTYSILACVQAIVMLTSSSAAGAADVLQLGYPMPNAV